MAEDLLPLLGINIGDNGSDSSDSDSGEDEEEAREDAGEEEVIAEEVQVELEDEQEEEREKVEKKKKAKKKEKKKRERQDSVNITFDTSLPGTHSYLGDDLEEIRGRTIHEDDSTVTLPLIALPGMVLVPGQVIPLHLFNQHDVAMMKSVVDSDKTFGIIAYRDLSSHHIGTFAGIGTTAEIFSVKDETDDATGISTVRVKARGRQRFELVEYRRQVTGILMGKVKILPESILYESLDSVRPASYCRFCCCSADADADTHTAVDRRGQVIATVKLNTKPKVTRFTAAYFTWWPPWVYKMYDAKILVERTQTELQKWNDTLTPDKMPSDPTELSYWITQNLPLDDSLRLHLLSINNAVQRLRCALSIIKKYSVLCCKECGRQIANKSDVFSLSLEGPLGAYVNPGGYVHEAITLHHAQNLSLRGRPSTEHSWFPGYAWTIASCKGCMSHMGWKFTATKKHLSPQKFWGLCRPALIPGIQNTDENSEEDWMPVM